MINYKGKPNLVYGDCREEIEVSRVEYVDGKATFPKSKIKRYSSGLAKSFKELTGAVVIDSNSVRKKYNGQKCLGVDESLPYAPVVYTDDEHISAFYKEAKFPQGEVQLKPIPKKKEAAEPSKK